MYLASGVTLALAILGFPFWHAHGKSKTSVEIPPNALKWTTKYPKSKIFPCQTTHVRMFPKKHAFRYSYLQCGYPIVPDATTVGGIDFSVGRDRYLGSWWLRARADDHLDRGNGHLGFYGKLKMYLREQVSTCYG